MTITIRAKVTSLELKPEIITFLMSGLEQRGYVPLISEAKGRFLKVFGETSNQQFPFSGFDVQEIMDDPMAAYYLSSRSRYSSGFRALNGLLLAGDLFFEPNANGVLYVAFILPSTALDLRDSRGSQ